MDSLGDSADSHRARVAVLTRDRQCTECDQGRRSVSVIKDAKGLRGVCGRCHVVLMNPVSPNQEFGFKSIFRI